MDPQLSRAARTGARRTPGAEGEELILEWVPDISCHDTGGLSVQIE
jgi:hypothetical protein